MAAFVTSRSSSEIASSINNNNKNNKNGSSAFSVPRRRPSYERDNNESMLSGSSHRRSSSLERHDDDRSSSKKLFRKRPRSQDATSRERERTGGSRNNNSTSTSSKGRDGERASSSSSISKPQKVHTSNGTTTTSSSTANNNNSTLKRSSMSSSSGVKSERRSSMSSVKSTTSSNSSQSTGLRRLKKFSSSGSSSKKKTKPSPPSSPVKRKQAVVVDEAPLSPSDAIFQETQLRLWEAAQERHRKMKEAQEQKRFRKLKKKKQKKEQLGDEEEDTVPPPTKKSNDNGRDSSSSTVKKKKTHDGERQQQQIKSVDKKSKKETEPDDSTRADDEIEALRERKRLKKLKKQQRLAAAEAERATNESSKVSDEVRSSAKVAREATKVRDETGPTTTTTKTSSKELATLDSEELRKKKKKRRLAKMGIVNGDEEDEEAPPRKKKKKKRIAVVESDDDDDENKMDVSASNNDKKDVSTTTDRKPTSSNKAASSPSTPERKPNKTKDLDSLLSTPLSFGLADTVKTRVRLCTKVKDELELLQAASFESKKRRKKLKQQRQQQVDYDYDDNDEDFVEEKPVLKKKKKKKAKQPLFADSKLYAPLSVNNATSNDQAADEDMYDADAEEPPSWDVRQVFRSDKVATAKAPSEASSNSDTVITGKLKKKKKLKTFRSQHDSGSTQPTHHSSHPLPFKKRMAAAAAADSSVWDRHTTTSTTASKVSVSSAGTGAAPELGTEASSISEFTHPLGAAVLPPLSASNNGDLFQKPSQVPREIVSKTAVHPQKPETFDFGVDSHNAVIGPTFSSDDSDSDSSSSSSDTDEEELFNWANAMFGTAAKPPPKEEQTRPCPPVEQMNLPPEMCEMERRRQKQEEARTLSIKEVNAIMNEELNNPEPAAHHWVRRSVRQPSRGVLNSPLVRRLLDKLRGNDKEMVVLKMKKYLSDPDTPSMLIDAALDALEENTNCEALYIQNFNIGMKDKQMLHLLRILQMPACNIWCLNIGETYNVTEETWEIFADGLKKTKVTHMYASEHTITAELKDEIRETIRQNRTKHKMHNDPNNLDVIIQCTHNWWNPINARVLRPYLQKRGYESLLHDREAQGLRGSVSEAPAA